MKRKKIHSLIEAKLKEARNLKKLDKILKNHKELNILLETLVELESQNYDLNIEKNLLGSLVSKACEALMLRDNSTFST